MRAVIQRITQASVVINGKEERSSGMGFLILLGVEENDIEADAVWLSQKVVQMRIFSDDNGQMNLSLLQVNGEVMVVSQFTLHASTRKGNRPSFIRAAKPSTAIPLYQSFINNIKAAGINVTTGEFGADMKITLTNDGPVTIIADTKWKE